MENIYLVYLLIIFYFTNVSGQNARINAPAQFILNTDMVKIYCQPAGLQYASINALTIQKNNQPMVSVGRINGQTSIAWSDSSVQSRATVNAPNLDTVSTAQLRVTIEATNTQCNDQAVYTCTVFGLDSSFMTVPNNEVSANISVVVKPDRMDEMTVSPLPSAEGKYSEGQSITLSCTGTVGSYPDPPKIAWCIQRNGDNYPSDLESDSYFRSITQSNAQAVGSGPTTSCQFQRTSRVFYQVANTDTDTTLWCQITAPGDSPICGQGTVRQQKSIKVAETTESPGSGVSRNEPETTESPGSGVSRNERSDVNGLLIGAIIGGVASMILALTLFAVIVFYRRKFKKTDNNESNGHTKNKNICDTLNSSTALSDVSTYNAIYDIGNTSRETVQNASTYERLDHTYKNTEVDVYQGLNNADRI